MKQLGEALRYRKGDWLRAGFALSAGCFSLLCARYREIPFLVIGTLVTVIAAFCLDRKHGYTDLARLPKLWSLLTAALCTGILLFRYWGFVFEPVPMDGAYVAWKHKLLFLGFDIASFPFVLVVLTRLLDRLFPALWRLCKATSCADRILAGAVFLLACVAVGALCARTNVFYDPATDSFVNPNSGTHEVWFDVLFTSDSGHLLVRDAFWNPSCVQNDLRQPFFALIALPFALIAEIIAWIPVDNLFAAVLLVEQILCLYACSLIVARLLGFRGAIKHVVSLCFCAVGGNLLLALILEQYAFAVFWLLLAVDAAVKRRKCAGVCTALSAGGLATSILLAPMATEAYGGKRPFGAGLRALVIGCLKIAGWFALIVCAFGQASQFAPAPLREVWSGLGEFTGKSVGLGECVVQYTHFVANLFLLPSFLLSAYSPAWDAAVPSLQLYPAEHVSILGLLLLIAAVAAFLFCRRDRFAGICAYWISVSFVILALFGWGASENGMILYSMYFAWAFFGLFAAAIKKLMRGNFLCLLCIFSAVFVLFLVWNGIALSRIVQFGLVYYPA